MLILSRRRCENILIGDDVEITVVRIDDGKVKIGIKAPREIPVHRQEVYKKIKEQTKEHQVPECLSLVENEQST